MIDGSSFIIIVFIFGAVVGSFLNVCIVRLPAGESITHPPSRCPACKARIAFYDNIPLLSYLILRGRCGAGRGLYLVALLYELATGTEGMGGGDIKLLAMIGAFLGWPGVPLALFFASLAGALMGIVLMVL